MQIKFDKVAEAKYTGKLAADWIRDLEASNSRLHKEGVIEKALVAARLGSASAECFLYNCYLAYNPYFTYNVKQVAETEGYEYRENPWVAFWGLCESLRTRTITGNKAREAIEILSERFDSEQWNGLCRRVLIKDLRCGITITTLNKMLGNSEWKIPTFDVQLATDSKGHPNKLRGICRLEPKLDGVRTIAIAYRNGTVMLYSRNGKEFTNFPHIAEQVRAIAQKHRLNYDLVLDGEIIGESFQQLMKHAHRKEHVENSADYYVFDIMRLDEFKEGHCNRNQHNRILALDALVNMSGCPNIHLVPSKIVDFSKPSAHEVMTDYATQAVSDGYEGIMIKDMNAPYECRRNTFWMKWKPVITVDLEVVALEEGTGRNEGRLGALVCEGTDQGRNIRVNVGSGLSDSARDDIWNRRDSMLGMIVEIKADAVTQNQDGSYSLRFPRFERFRGFEPGEKI